MPSPAPENDDHFQGAGDGVTRPENDGYFQGQVTLSPASRNTFLGAGQLVQ